MIIKCISRKSNVHQLIQYVLTDEKLAPVQEPSKRSWYVPGVKLTKEDIKHLESEKMDAKLLAEFRAFKGTIKEFIDHCISKNCIALKQNMQSAIVIKNNIRARSVNGYIKEFEANEKFRLHDRKDSVKAYHTILSFSQLDSKHLNAKILKDIAQHYISLRAEQSLVVGGIHFDKSHIHMHIIQSGTQYCTGLSNRISKQEFQELKVAMQEYQKEKYPQLIHSMPEHGKSKNGKTIEKGSEKNIKRNERTSEKNILLGLLETTYAKSISANHFLEQIKAQGHEPYYRNGRLQGIKYEGERKFRLNNLGYDEKKLQALDIKREKEEKVLKEIHVLRSGRNSRINEGVQNEMLEKSRSLEKAALNINDKNRDQLQELVNQNREFVRTHNNASDIEPLSKSENSNLQEIKEIRENKNQELDKNEGFEHNGRDAVEDRNSDDDRDEKGDTGNKMDDDTEDEDSGSSNADDLNDDDDDVL